MAKNRALIQKLLSQKREEQVGPTSSTYVPPTPAIPKPPVIKAEIPKLTPDEPQHIELARLMAQGLTISQASKTLGISSSTARRWARSPMFISRYNDLVKATDEAVISLKKRLQFIAGDALDLLHQYIVDESDEVPPKIKLEAAKTAIANSKISKTEAQTPMTTQVNIAIQSIDSAMQAAEIIETTLNEGSND